MVDHVLFFLNGLYFCCRMFDVAEPNHKQSWYWPISRIIFLRYIQPASPHQRGPPRRFYLLAKRTYQCPIYVDWDTMAIDFRRNHVAVNIFSRTWHGRGGVYMHLFCKRKVFLCFCDWRPLLQKLMLKPLVLWLIPITGILINNYIFVRNNWCGIFAVLLNKIVISNAFHQRNDSDY